MHIWPMIIRHHPSKPRLKLITAVAGISGLAMELLCDSMTKQLESSLSAQNLELPRLRADILLDMCFPQHTIALPVTENGLISCWPTMRPSAVLTQLGTLCFDDVSYTPSRVSSSLLLAESSS